MGTPTTYLRRACLVAALLGALWLAPTQAQQTDRDAWQRPAEVMDALGVGEGSVVADIGCGTGYFTMHLARRVGSTGRVYAVDIDPYVISDLTRTAAGNNLTQIRPVLSQPDDPRLPPASLDIALIANTYHEFTHHDAMLAKIYIALKPGGLLSIIDRPSEPGQPRSYYLRRHRIPKELVLEDAARHGFVFLWEAPGFTPPGDPTQWYFLIFQKPSMAGPEN